jgi:hypothetical protein
MNICRSCPARVLWLANVTTHKRAPIDAAPAVGGNIVVDLDAGTYRIVTGIEREDMIGRGDPLHLNHFVTCPNAAEHKGRR